jgi:hypothetical protein
MFAEFLFQALWFGKKCNAVISLDLVPKVPGFGHVLRILAHDLFGCYKPRNRDLRKAAEEKLFVGGSLEPLSGLFRMHVPAPEQCEPNIRIKEIQRIHKYVCWSDLPWGLSRR